MCPPPTCNKVVVKTNYHDPDVKPPCSGGPGCANQSDCCALCANEPKCAVAVWSKPDASCTLKLSADQPYPCEKHAGLSGGAPPPHAVELVFDIEADPNENVDLSQDPAHKPMFPSGHPLSPNKSLSDFDGKSLPVIPIKVLVINHSLSSQTLDFD